MEPYQLFILILISTPTPHQTQINKTSNEKTKQKNNKILSNCFAPSFICKPFNLCYFQAGPTPEKGLGKLQKYNFFFASFGVRLPPVKDDVPIVTRSIMIIRNTVFEPVSPSSSSATTPRTPNTRT